MSRSSYVQDPENWYMIEICQYNGFVDEIFQCYYSTKEEYESDLEGYASQRRTQILGHRPPLRKGLNRYKRFDV